MSKTTSISRAALVISIIIAMVSVLGFGILNFKWGVKTANDEWKQKQIEWIAETQNKLDKQKIAYSDTISILRNEKETLLSKIQKYTGQISDLETNLKKTESSYRNLQKKYQDITNELNSKNRQISELNKSNSRLYQEKKQTELALSESKNKLSSLKSDLTSVQTQRERVIIQKEKVNYQGAKYVSEANTAIEDAEKSGLFRSKRGKNYRRKRYQSALHNLNIASQQYGIDCQKEIAYVQNQLQSI